MSTERERAILKLATKHTTSKAVRAWLLWDENGFWENGVRAYIERAARERPELSEQEVNEGIAGIVALEAMEATIRDAKKRGAA